jgi:hypothetical protein
MFLLIFHLWSFVLPHGSAIVVRLGLVYHSSFEHRGMEDAGAAAPGIFTGGNGLGSWWSWLSAQAWWSSEMSERRLREIDNFGVFDLESCGR